MKRPYIISHMMMSLDGRIDCAMTEKLEGTEEYYRTLDSFHASTHLSGRVTAEKEMALKGKFHSDDDTRLGKEEYFKASDKEGYEVIVDTKGTLLWEDQEKEEKPLLVLLSEEVSLSYLEYLKERHISYIATGIGRVDLSRACELLFGIFSVKRMAVVGGGHINASFLEEGLLDEISVLVGPGIDGREGMGAVFDGRKMSNEVTPLKLKDVKVFDCGALWLKYLTK